MNSTLENEICHINSDISFIVLYYHFLCRWNDRIKKFRLLQRWKLKHLPGNVSLHVGKDRDTPAIMVSQPGCSYALLHVGWVRLSCLSLKEGLYYYFPWILWCFESNCIVIVSVCSIYFCIEISCRWFPHLWRILQWW